MTTESTTDDMAAVRCSALLGVNSENSQQKQTHNELHLFAGAGGGILGGTLLGHTTVCAVEIESHARKLLTKRQRDGILPHFPIWDDITTFDGQPWKGIVDIICGGFPCQDISSVGTRAGVTGRKSGLWAEMGRVICEIQPRTVFVENSPMLTARGLGDVLGDLAGMGYDAAWGVLAARDARLPHNRERIWIYASNANVQRGGSCVPKLHPENRPNMGKHNEAFDSFDRLLAKFEGQAAASKSEGGLPSYICGMDDGMADGVDRLSRIGNGQVPIVAAMAWRILERRLLTPNIKLTDSRPL